VTTVKKLLIEFPLPATWLLIGTVRRLGYR